MFASKLFRAALAPLALTAALVTSEAAYAQATPYNVFAYAVGGSRGDPCAIMYAIAPAGTARYTAANGYTLVRSAPNRAVAQQMMLKFSKYHDDKADGIVKLIPCKSASATTSRNRTTGGLSFCTYKLSKYKGLLQKIHYPNDRGRYGVCYEYGYWRGTTWRGMKVQPGYWIYANDTWYVFSDRTSVRTASGR